MFLSPLHFEVKLNLLIDFNFLVLDILLTKIDHIVYSLRKPI
jgi:hypothetical protein